uniref:DNA ligase n=1 Tax=Cacopsylla melanoneura TaxID=428564 RepID=A0A8D8WGN6_9HEMI
MSDNENKDEPNPEDEKNFWVDRAKTGRAGCKKCKQKLETGALRIAKLAYNPFGAGKMKQWHHMDCILEVFKKQRPTTAKIETVDDMGGWDDLTPEDQEEVMSRFPESLRESNQNRDVPDRPEPSSKPNKKAKTPKKKSKDSDHDSQDEEPGPSTSKKSKVDSKSSVKKSKKEEKPGSPESERDAKLREKDNSFREFRKLCAEIAEISSYTGKTEAVKEFFQKGSGKVKFRGDLVLWTKLLLPGAVKRIYNLQSKQIVKLFSRLFGTDQDAMLESLEQGDVAETIRIFHEQSRKMKPAKKGNLSLQQVDSFLEDLSKMTKEDDQVYHFEQICPQCSSNDLKMIIRLIKHDLRINSGPKHILNAIHPDAYQAFQTSRDLESVVRKLGLGEDHDTSGEERTEEKSSSSKERNIALKLMTPVLPMLAEACKSVEQAMKKCPHGMYSEIKYDGERVQVHKQGNEFKYFSRSLKPVLDHKVRHFKDYLPKAFPHGKDLVLDSEILLVDKASDKPLPFGSLGKHKKDEFSDASVCLFVFDCIYFNGESLLDRPIRERKKILKENMQEIRHHVVLSEMEEIHQPEDLEGMMTKVFRQGLEGLVLKDIESIYKPGKRHWLKVKKDYLFGGSMADSADLVVLGAWYGTGNKGGMMSVFLMGCYDPDKKKWCTVTKVHGGHDDKTLERLQTELDMVKISKDATRVPDWLNCKKTMIPDFVARDPKAQPVWEIAGAEFTQAEIHTADGISIRFPRVTRIRDDKDWKTATNLPELKTLFKKSKETSDFTLKPNKRTKDTSPTPSSGRKTSESPPPAQKARKEDYESRPKDNLMSNNLLISFLYLYFVFISFFATDLHNISYILFLYIDNNIFSQPLDLFF